MKPLARNSLSDQIFDIISRKIVRNELKPGELIYETQMSKELGVSRSPVRDALHMLERIRLVERTDKGSYQVAEMSVDFIEHFYDTVITIYQYVAIKATQNATYETLDLLKQAMAQIEYSLEKKDFDLYLSGVTRFGYAILKAAGNPFIERIALELMPNTERIQWAAINYLPDQMETIIGHVRQGYHSILEKKPENAAQAFYDFATTHREIAITSLMNSPNRISAAGN